MDSAMKQFEHLVVKLEEVKSATENFNDTKIIGKGGFGYIYEGELSQRRGKTKVAFKRLDRKHGQDYPEFWNEVMILSRYTHENLISLLGYCNEGGEMILVYEHASNGSLDRHLSSTTLTWTQRIRICHDVAKGLCYLHQDKGNLDRVLHRDIKSSNILLDENWKAKVSDMGMAMAGSSNMYTFFITGTVGTHGYIDPVYLRLGFLTEESDVYSFGVVLFEVLCGRLCFEYSKAEAHSGNIVHIWKQRYEENKLDEIMFKADLVQALDQSSLEVFSEIAFQCLQESHEKRPKMSDVVEKLEIALKYQELVDLMIPKEYQEIVMTAVPPLIYRSVEELKVLLSKGVLLNGGKTWLRINEKGEHIERIYIQACLDEIEARYLQDDIVNSRFPGGRCYEYTDKFKARVRGEYLTPQISYTANLVFRFKDESDVNSYINPLRYKIDGEANVFIIYPSYMGEDGWFIVPLYQLTSQHTTVDLQFQFEYPYHNLLVAGIEFQPSEEKLELPVFEEYQHIVEAASQSLFYTSLDELKQILSKGVLLNGYKTWLSTNEKGEHIEKIYIEACLNLSEIEDYSYKLKYPSDVGIVNSRFPGGRCYEYHYEFKACVRAEYLTPHISYTLNLIFRYKYQSVNSYDPLRYKIDGEAKDFIIYPSYMREDGWFIVPLYQFTSQHTTVDLQFEFEDCNHNLLVAGIEFQPYEEKVQPIIMASSMNGFEHLEIQLEEIISATNNFNEKNVIGHGGFGKVYKGELSHSHSTGKSMVALKRLDPRHGQGDAEFHKEVRMLSCYRHENIISLLGFSSGWDEMILVYEYAYRGSLDGYLKNVNLTWTQRLKICLDAAKGLSYLHDPRETYQRLIHCDIKTANILLDENFKAKVSDFGLSKIGPANQKNSILVTGTLGTPGYCDPVFMETYTLTKESDVYSFGIVLFEVLCGKLCVEYNNKGQIKATHVPMWKQSYEQKQLSGIVFQGLMEQMNQDSLETFSGIAYQCLKRFREERPAMSRVVEKLQESLALQELHDLKLPKEYEEIVNAAVPPLNYRSLDELKVLLTKGFHVNEGTTWLSINEKGEHIKRIYIEACLNPAEIKYGSLRHLSDHIVNSRFPGGLCYRYQNEFQARVRGQFLTTQTSYTLNLVFRHVYESLVNSCNPLRYKIDGEAKVFMINPSTHMREYGWFIVPLYHITTQHKTADLQFQFEYRDFTLLVAGFEFQPSEEKVQLQVFEEYQHVVEAASQSIVYRSLQELKQILSIGIHLKDYKTWFSLNEKGEHCHMISMKDCLIPNEDSTPQYESHHKSRFPAGFYLTNNKGFKTHVKTQLLSPSITYTVNLVIISSRGKAVYVDLKYRLRGEATTSVVYLANQRQDDWLHMAELFQFTGDGSIVDLEIDFDDHGSNLQVEGILFQPLEKVEDQVSKDDKVENIQTISNSDSDSLIRTTKEKLYSIFRRRSGQEWLSVDKHGKKCLMLSAKATWVIDDKNSAFESSHESRFGEVLVITAGDKFELVNEIKPKVLSADTTYASYFVYKLPSDKSKFEAPLCVWEKDGYMHNSWYVYFVSPPNTPVIGQNFDENRYNPLNRHKLSALPRQRSDGWMEVRVWEFQTKKTPKTVSMNLFFKHPAKKDLCGLIIHGIELRPI